MMRKEWKEGVSIKPWYLKSILSRARGDISDLPDSLLNIDNRWLTLT